jgi:hypothetical protein
MKKLMTVFSALLFTTALGASGCKKQNASDQGGSAASASKTTESPTVTGSAGGTTASGSDLGSSGAMAGSAYGSASGSAYNTGAGSASGSAYGSASGSSYGSASGSAMGSGSASGSSAMTGSGSGSAIAADTGIAECDTYVQTFNRYLACPSVPDQAKGASQANIAQMQQSWSSLKDPNTPAAAKKAAADACKQAVDALQSSAKALGCNL